MVHHHLPKAITLKPTPKPEAFEEETATKITAMASNPATLRSLYRSLLRELPPRPILARNRSPIHARIRSSFAEPAAAHPAAATEAAQFLDYLRAQRVYATLLERYNPGMGMDEEERVRLTARRVGMDLPKEFGKQ
ncbi:hypothetical protein VDGD_10069 [Verticillium dahliae]|nr:Putative 6-phosphogluconolactonase [Verticillium dahliae VDG2]KAH6700748.1 hypothetical protein EV126DRAFT_420455 [Verticillium dahliae]RBQ99466.1 hypothetical protein VDGD_10069 [Verticillium dahliae]